MRAVVMRNKKLAVADVPEPAPEAGEVLVRTLACGICGSDLHALQHAARTAPLAVGLHAVNKERLDPDDAPLVIGCGPVGLAVIAALRLADVRPIVAADFSARRRELALALGADVVVDPAAQTPWQSWRDAAVWRDGARAPAPPSRLPRPARRPRVALRCLR